MIIKPANFHFVHNGRYGQFDLEIENKLDEMSEEFLKSLLEDYRIILENEYEYLTSKEAILETIEANDYEFTADGTIY